MNKATIYFCLFIGYFFLRNIFMPLSNDDFGYSFIWDGENGGNFLTKSGEEFQHRDRVESLSDIFKSQYSHYFTWGGRIVAHFFAQFFLWIGKSYFEIANTIIFAIFIILILKLSNTEFKKSEFAIGWIFFTLFCVSSITPLNIACMTWLTGSCNYLWMATLQLAFLLPYVIAIRSGKIVDSKLKIFFMAVFGIFAGWSNEAGSLATIFLVSTLTLLAIREKLFQKWMAAGLSTAMIGSFFCITSPGNFVQTEWYHSIDPVMFNFTPEHFKGVFLNAFLPIIGMDLVVLLPMIIYFFKRGLIELDISEKIMLAFAAAGFIVPLAMMFSPKFDSFIAIVSFPFMLVASIAAYGKLKFYIPKKFGAAIFLAAVIYAIPLLGIQALIYRDWQNQIENVLAHKNDEIVYVPKVLEMPKIFTYIYGGTFPNHKYFHPYIGGVTADKNFFNNVMMAQYYGVKSIIAKE